MEATRDLKVTINASEEEANLIITAMEYGVKFMEQNLKSNPEATKTTTDKIYKLTKIIRHSIQMF